MDTAGPVTITRPDGTTRVQPAYTPDELRAVLAAGRSAARICQGITYTGQRCRRYAIYDTPHCQTHGGAQ